MRPVGVFESGVSPGGWREVTVNGHVRKMREERSSRVPGEEVGGGREGGREGEGYQCMCVCLHVCEYTVGRFLNA